MKKSWKGQEDMDREKKAAWKLPSIKEYVTDHKITWWIVGFFLVFSYGIKMFNVSLSHDTEAMVAVPGLMYDSWYTMGRFGLIFLKKLLGTYAFNPYIASFMMVVMMGVNSVLWSYLFWWLTGGKEKKNYVSWIFPTACFTAPIFAEQSGFLLQAYEVNVAILLVGIALLNLYFAILNEKKWYWYIPAAVCCIIAFSTYQTLLPLFMAGAAVCFLCVYDRCVEQKRNVNISFYWILIGKLILTFVCSFILYQGINKLVLYQLDLETTSYITEQIFWGKNSIRECLGNIIDHIYSAMTGRGIFYSGMNLIAYAAMIVFCILRIAKRQKGYILYLLAAAFCLISPFLMTILMGNAPTARTEIVLPFMVGVLLQYLVNRLFVCQDSIKVKSMVYRIAVTGIALWVMYQSLTTAQLYYTQYVQYEEDVRLAVKISDRIERLNLGESPTEPVFFIGTREPVKNASCLEDEQLELIGKSFFAISYGTSHGSWVMRNFMDSLGYSYIYTGDATENALAEQDAAQMPCWPDEGSVAVKNGRIIVKLSE